jgi:hypothetical protein
VPGKSATSSWLMDWCAGRGFRWRPEPWRNMKFACLNAHTQGKAPSVMFVG